jgi:hypothetical protein
MRDGDDSYEHEEHDLRGFAFAKPNVSERLRDAA